LQRINLLPSSNSNPLTCIKVITPPDQEDLSRVFLELNERSASEPSLTDLRDNSLQKSLQERFQIIFEHAPDAYFLHDLEGKILDGNQAAEQLLGYDRGELIGKNFLKLNIFPEDEVEKILDGMAHSELGQATGPEEYRLIRKDGSRIDVEISTRPVLLEGTPLVLGIARDVTRRKQAQRDLEKSEERYHSLFENVPIGLYRSTPEGKWTDVNWPLVKILGYPSKSALLDVNVSNLYVNPEDEVRWRERIDSQQVVTNFETQLYRYDGSKIWVLDNTRAVHDQQGRLEAFEGGLKDITKRKRAEHDLQRSEEKYRRFFETSHACVFISSCDGAWLEMNQAAADMFGYRSKEELSQVPIRELYAHPEERDLFVSEIESKGETRDFLVKLRRKSGELIDGLISAKIYQQDGQIIGYQGTIRNITDQVAYAAELKQRTLQLEALQEIGLNLSSELNLDELLENIVHHAVKLVNGEGGSFYLPDECQRVLKAAVRIGYQDLPQDVHLKQGEGLIGRVWEKGETILVEDYAHWEYCVPVLAKAFGRRSLIGVPVIWGGEFRGVLEILHPPEHPFSDEDRQLLEMLATQAAVALHNARLFGNAQLRLHRLRSLREIDRSISSSLDLKTTLTVIIKRLVSSLKVDAGSILLLNPDTLRLEYVTGTGFQSETIAATQIRMGEGCAGRAAQERKTIFVEDLSRENNHFEFNRLIREEEFFSYFGVPLLAKGKLLGVLEVFHRSRLNPGEEWREFFETLANQAALAIDHLQMFQDLERTNLELNKAYHEVIEGWARALEMRDDDTEGHSRRVEELTLALAREMGVEPQKMASIRKGALLHDIGKMGIPDSILHKPSQLTEKEWELMKEHPRHAYHLLSPIEHLRPALDIPYCHHENWDGSGYPRGLSGEEIPLAARIFSIVDVWDALRSDRPYRNAWSDEEALSYIKEQTGKKFDPQVVKAFLSVISSQ
jgi:PAS domain S-box-containing protein/putative nucleotidyltransferase with HDIG domain